MKATNDKGDGTELNVDRLDLQLAIARIDVVKVLVEQKKMLWVQSQDNNRVRPELVQIYIGSK